MNVLWRYKLCFSNKKPPYPVNLLADDFFNEFNKDD